MQPLSAKRRWDFKGQASPTRIFRPIGENIGLLHSGAGTITAAHSAA